MMYFSADQFNHPFKIYVPTTATGTGSHICRLKLDFHFRAFNQKSDHNYTLRSHNIQLSLQALCVCLDTAIVTHLYTYVQTLLQ